MYNDLKKGEKEKSQLTALVNSLQKEATAKDLLVKKGKSEIEKLRVTLRNKENELATISTKVFSVIWVKVDLLHNPKFVLIVLKYTPTQRFA